MKKLLKVLLIVAMVVVVMIAAIALFLLWASKQPAVKEDYHRTSETGGEIEAKYTALGAYEVGYFEIETDTDYKKIRVWYPAELESENKTYPLVIMVNGTGVPCAKYEAIFKHLASWGFIVVGNEDENARTGKSSSESLSFMLEQNKDSSSIFYGKIDENSIGIGGHSQGGVGAVNAVTNYDNGTYYTAMWTASTTSSFMTQDSGLGKEWQYDTSKVTIPYFMVAGASGLDAGTATSFDETEGQGICPLWSLQENYEKIGDTVEKVMARRKNTDHAPMLYSADGYMTAWFMYQLQGDEYAKGAFCGRNAEILTNENWQDARTNH